MKQSINTKMRMRRKIFLAVMAGIVFTACSDQLADTPPVVNSPETQGAPIMFGLESKGSTRTNFVGAEAANLLDNKFVVTGFKGSSTDDADRSIVFDNYLVVYEENTAYTTESNTRNWEYVGKGLTTHAENNGITSQSMKYWDYSKPQYDFIAWSTGKKTAIFEEPTSGTIPSGKVLVSAIDPSSLGTAAYSYTGRSADLMDCYIADIVTRKKAQYGDDPVTIKFRSLGAKVRMGIYETIPGYSVRNVEFYNAFNSASHNNTPKLFTTDNASLIYNSGTYTVYYPTVGEEGNPDNNQAHVKFVGTGDQSSIVDFSSLNYFGAEESEKTTGDVFLGRSSNAASMAGEAEGNYFSPYLPNETGTSLNLRVNYVLESTDGSGEIIEVKGAYCQVPSFYTQWKAGYAYTYLFKISDRTNGYATDDNNYDPITGVPLDDDTPAGLYPITFDAIVVNSEDGDQTQETITLVSTPSITTYMEGQVVINNNEYTITDNPIYVTVGENDDLVELDESNAAVYKLDNNSCTEADIVDALTYSADNTASIIIGRNNIGMVKQSITPVSTIENGVDGSPIDLGANKAVKFQPSVGTFAFVYTQTDPTVFNDVYVPISKVPYEDVTGLYRNFKLEAASGNAQTGVIYFSMDGDGKLMQVENLTDDDSVEGYYVYTSTPAERHACFEGEKAVSGHGYFDKYTKNNGVYYTKVIKVVGGQ